MPKTIFTGDHQLVVAALLNARLQSGLTQVELASRLGKTQTFISLIERGQRRIDVLEWFELCSAIGTDPVELYRSVVAQLQPRGSI